MKSCIPVNVPGTSLSLVLTPFRPGDEQELTELLQDETVHKFMPCIPDPYTPDSAKSFLDATRRQKNKYGTHLTYAVRELPQSPDAPGRLVGSVGVGELRDGSEEDLRKPLPHKVPLGYWLAPGIRGYGAMAAVLREFLQQLFASHAEVRRVYGKVLVTNEASIRTLRSAGLRFEGTLRDDEFLRGEYVDSVLYAIIRTDHTRKEE